MGKYCGHCGAPLKPGARFCAKCGTPLLAQPAPPPESTETPKAAIQPSSVETCAYPTKQEMTRPGRKNDSGNGLCLALAALFVLESAIVALFGWPGFAMGGKTQSGFNRVEVHDGIARAEGVVVNLKDDQDIKHFGIARVPKSRQDPGAVSETFEFAFDEIPEGNIVISMPVRDGFTLSDEAIPYLDIGISVTGDDGEEFEVFDFVRADVSNNMLSAEFTPSAYASPEECVSASSATRVKSTYSDRFRFSAAYTVKLIKRSQSGHFNLLFSEYDFIAASMAEDDFSAILSRMEQIYEQMQVFGFDLTQRTKWPMDVYIKTFLSRTTMGEYLNWFGINRSYINLKSGLFFNKASLDEISGVFAHEFTHFVQDNHISTGHNLRWLNESTAVFFERYFGGRTDHQAKQYQVFEGIYPQSDSADAGYARGSVISYWAWRNGWLDGTDSLSGKDKMSGLVDLYSTGGYLKESRWYEWIDALLGAPSEYALDFYTHMVMCDEVVWAQSAYVPYVLHQAIIDGKDDDIKAFTKKMELLYDRMAGEEGQSLLLSVPAYGARVVALSMDEQERDRLEKDSVVTFSIHEGAELVLFKCNGAKVESIDESAAAVPGFAESLKNGERYLVLVVNPTDKVISAELNVARCESEDTESEQPAALADDLLWFHGGWTTPEAIDGMKITISLSIVDSTTCDVYVWINSVGQGGDTLSYTYSSGTLSLSDGTVIKRKGEDEIIVSSGADLVMVRSNE